MIKKFLFILPLLLISCSKKPSDYNIKTFGAVGDGVTLNTHAIQEAINACHTNGGGVIKISEGKYLTGTILLKDHVHLIIEEGATLMGSSDPRDYKSIDTFTDATGQERGNCLIGSLGAKDISISGKGIIDGNGTAFKHENLAITKKKLGINPAGFGKNRPFLLRFVRSSNISLKNIQLKQPAAWACHFYESQDIVIDSISIYSHANFNNDGIDLDSSHNITISNCHIDTGDDAICFKTTSLQPTYNANVKNCTLKSDWGAIKFGTESMGDFYDIHISDCKIVDTKGGGIKILSVDGANINDVSIENIEMKNVDMPIFIRLGERLRTYRQATSQGMGSMKNISIKNIRASTRALAASRVSPPSGIFITGTPNHAIEKVHLENIHISLPGNGKLDAIQKVPELEKKYPEFSFFGMLPAYGMYARHIKHLEHKNLTFLTDQLDERDAIIIEDLLKTH